MRSILCENKPDAMDQNQKDEKEPEQNYVPTVKVILLYQVEPSKGRPED